MPTIEASKNTATLNVAIAVIKKQHKIFISKRSGHVHLSGLWEFPGGKVELNETPETAMIRECQEEIGITPTRYRPLITVNYPAKNQKIFINVFLVSEYLGQAYGKENQQTQWVQQSSLYNIAFPKINRVIINAITLPNRLAITQNCIADENSYLQQIESNIKKHNIKLLQFRSPNLTPSQRRPLAIKLLAICKKYQCEMLLNGDIGGDEIALGIENIHLTSKKMLDANQTSFTQFKMLSASCHNKKELEMAQNLGCYFALLSPVKKTQTHPSAIPMGWSQFNKLAQNINMPIYALGGLTKNDIDKAQFNGAQGIATIRDFYK